jgi:hypothetical protein
LDESANPTDEVHDGDADGEGLVDLSGGGASFRHAPHRSCGGGVRGGGGVVVVPRTLGDPGKAHVRSGAAVGVHRDVFLNLGIAIHKLTTLRGKFHWFVFSSFYATLAQ